ncbi:hypothetical protein [Thiothrix lacustris]|uniref:hypothetical protein n=1 Tax=Thiothrix lacustris TaxID=525917 RepID=UPI0027E52F16|nr:hypothetical protein [Thiothrix lacustris]WMP16671.1 hypothetical protein RCS87_14990 [Thiothrix lacustris]
MTSNTYSLGWSLVFWLLWSAGLLALLLFGFFLLVTATNAPLASSWNALIVLAEGFLLFKTARHFARKDKPASELLLLAAVAAIGIPLLATGGCIMAYSVGGGLSIGV